MVEVCQTPSQCLTGCRRPCTGRVRYFCRMPLPDLKSCISTARRYKGLSMSVRDVAMTADIGARRRVGVTTALLALVAAAGADLARHRTGAAVAARRDRGAVRRRQRRGAGDRARDPAAARHSGICDRRDSRAVRRRAAGTAAQSAGLALAVRRAAIRRLRRGAGDRARAGRCAFLRAAGRRDHGGVRVGVRAAGDRRPQCGPADSRFWRALRSPASRAPRPRW